MLRMVQKTFGQIQESIFEKKNPNNVSELGHHGKIPQDNWWNKLVNKSNNSFGFFQACIWKIFFYEQKQ